METATSHFSSPAHTALLDNMSEPQYLKMEDLHTTASASPAPTPASDSGTYSQSSPAPIVVTSKPAKKRKSWGQELPEPKTALPPRKRAKTDDEKEQRRIERIKRNRAAAHNSRERKRQETEDLAVKLARANAELRAFRSHFGDLPSHIVLPEVKVEIDDSGCISTTTHSVSTPAPSLVESHGSQVDPSSPIPPADDTTLRQIKMEPNETSPDFAYPAFEDSKSSGFMPLDLTQHSAVSVQPHEHQFDFNSSLEQSHSLPDGYPATDMLQDAFSSYVDSFAFADGAYDASISGPLFSMEEFVNVNEDSHFANDAQTSGAV